MWGGGGGGGGEVFGGLDIFSTYAAILILSFALSYCPYAIFQKLFFFFFFFLSKSPCPETPSEIYDHFILLHPKCLKSAAKILKIGLLIEMFCPILNRPGVGNKNIFVSYT